MLQKTRSFVSSLVLLLMLGGLAPATANARPLGKLLHMHPAAQEQDKRITSRLWDGTAFARQIVVAGCVHTLLPNDGVMIKAPAGTEVLAASDSYKHRKGDVLVEMTADRNNSTVTLN